MREPKKPDLWRDLTMVACGFVIGMALDAELTEFLPDDPWVAIAAVFISAVLATGGTLATVRYRKG